MDVFTPSFLAEKNLDKIGLFLRSYIQKKFIQQWCIAAILNKLRELIKQFLFWESLISLKSRISENIYQGRLSRFLACTKLHSTQELGPRGGLLR
ncbi:MAG: hypothetical protein ACFFD2_08295 [Promethearchaeota archaeon]